MIYKNDEKGIYGEYDFAKKDEYLKLTREADYCFCNDENCGYFKQFYPKLYKEEYFMPEAHYVVRDGEKIVSLVCSYPGTVRIGDATLSYRGIGTVCVDPNYRSKGYMKVLMNAANDDMVKNNVDFAFLGGRRQRYEYFGYTPCGINADYSYNADNVRHFYGKDARFGYTFKTVEVSDEKILDDIFELYNKKEYCAKRERNMLFDILNGTYHHATAIYKDKTFFGYAVFNGEETDVSECELVDITEIGKVFADFIAQKGCWEVRFVCVYPFEVEKNEFLSKHSENVSIHNVGSFRIINYVNVLKALFTLKAKYSALADGTLTADIEGEKIIIEVKNGIADVREFDGDTMVSLSRLDADALFCGAWKIAGNRGIVFPGYAEGWFPLPITMTRPDFV